MRLEKIHIVQILNEEVFPSKTHSNRYYVRVNFIGKGENSGKKDYTETFSIEAWEYTKRNKYILM